MPKAMRAANQVIVLSFLSLTAFAGSIPEFTALPPIEHNVGEETGVQSLALGDVDDDGIPDMVVIDADSEEVTVYLGDGDGTFDGGNLVGLADLPSAVAIADLTSPFASGGDIDGIPDVIVVDEIGGLQIFIGRGDGTFDEPDQAFDDLDTVEIAGVAVADFDDNGRDDLALLESFDGVYFLCNDGGTLQGCPTPVVFLDEFSFDLVDIDVGDFDGAGGIDVAAVDFDSGQLYVIHGNGDGTFDEIVEPITIAAEAGVEPRALRVGSIAGEPTDDIVVLSSDTSGEVPAAMLSVLIAGDAPDGFIRTDYPAGEIGSALVLEDFDDDDLLDVVVVGVDEFDNLMSSSFMKGAEGGVFGAPISTGLEPITGGSAIEAADLDRSGTPDPVAVISFGTEIQALRNGPQPTACAGDCNGNGAVAINELITGVNIALGNTEVGACQAMDGNGNGVVAINELIAAVNRALNGCA